MAEEGVDVERRWGDILAVAEAGDTTCRREGLKHICQIFDGFFLGGLEFSKVVKVGFGGGEFGVELLRVGTIRADECFVVVSTATLWSSRLLVEHSEHVFSLCCIDRGSTSSILEVVEYVGEVGNWRAST